MFKKINIFISLICIISLLITTGLCTLSITAFAEDNGDAFTTKFNKPTGGIVSKSEPSGDYTVQANNTLKLTNSGWLDYRIYNQPLSTTVPMSIEISITKTSGAYIGLFLGAASATDPIVLGQGNATDSKLVYARFGDLFGFPNVAVIQGINNDNSVINASGGITSGFAVGEHILKLVSNGSHVNAYVDNMTTPVATYNNYVAAGTNGYCGIYNAQAENCLIKYIKVNGTNVFGIVNDTSTSTSSITNSSTSSITSSSSSTQSESSLMLANFTNKFNKPANATGTFTVDSGKNLVLTSTSWDDYRIYNKSVDCTNVTLEMAFTPNLVKLGSVGFFAGAESATNPLSLGRFNEDSKCIYVRNIFGVEDTSNNICLIGGQNSDGSFIGGGNTKKAIVNGVEHIIKMVIKGKNVSFYYDDMSTPVTTYDNFTNSGKYVGIYLQQALNTKIRYFKVNGNNVLALNSKDEMESVPTGDLPIMNYIILFTISIAMTTILVAKKRRTKRFLSNS